MRVWLNVDHQRLQTMTLFIACYNNNNNPQVAMASHDSSIVEAGALLGAAINRYGTAGSTINPPKGTHSSFSVLEPTPSSELMMCLHSLRSLLRSAPRDVPLVAAPSLLAGVLMKLLGISSNLAAANIASAAADPTRRTAIPPMLSTPLRKLWVDCVILCHTLGDGLSGNSRINIHGFVRSMIQLAAMNPRTARAAGGTRIAALEVIAGIMRDEKLSKQLSNWALDVIQLCQRALKSSGTGEPTYRIAAIQTASAAATASRTSFLSTRPGSNPLVLKGALEDKAIIEMIRLLKVAVADKYPEVRCGSAQLASLLAPLVIHTSIKSPNTPDAVAPTPVASLEDLMTVAFKHLDDESPMVAGAWGEALARCMSTAIEYNNMLSAEKTSNRNVEGDDGSPTKATSGGGAPGGRASRKGIVTAAGCSTLPKCLQFLVSMFIKLGGELTPPRSGAGVFSMGGRAIRNGFARTMIELLRLQSALQAVGEGKSISHKEAIMIILSMVGSDLDAQLHTLTGPVVPNNLFGQGPKVSPADGALARLAASRVLREGISVLSPESVQLLILHELIQVCSKNRQSMNGHQLQVMLIEISHLLVALGEATTSAADDLAPALKACLRHSDQGVRHEAAVACAAMTSVFPARGRQLVQESIIEIQVEHAELMATTSTEKEEPKQQEATVAGRFARFRRQQTPVKEVKVDESAKHKQAIHGIALMISVVMRDLPNLPGGLPSELLDMTMSVAEILVNTLFSDTMTANNPGGVCTCVKAGFNIICGGFATGPDGVTSHIALVFGLWQKVAKQEQRGGKFADAHELVCVESMLESAVAFLRYCSELLLSVPDALSRTSLLLEDVLPLLYPSGRLGKTQSIPAAVGHLDSAKAAILEAFAWLPPGSYPMIADDVFAFSAANIQYAIESEVSCSILRSLVSNEDGLLDAASFSRATSPGQVGGARDLEYDLVALKSEAASHNDRESVLHLLKNTKQMRLDDVEFLGSQVLGMIVSENAGEKPPTALHEVGTWRHPAMPSCSAKVRLVDAAIQAFSATFTLKSGKEQQNALQMLESLLPPPHIPITRGALADHNRRGRLKDDSAAATNVAAVLLFCLKALPVFESTHNVPINLGPMWMNKAKDVFLTMLRSPSQEVRRAAAEGLGFLSTLGVREDARFLQSAILHAVDEVIQGTQDQEQGKPLPLESISAGRSAALLSLACMQRTAVRIKKERDTRARERGNTEQNDTHAEDALDLFQILIKILPSVTSRPTGGFLGVRAVGMHAFGILFSYSKKLEAGTLTPQESHLLRKMAELIEDNFLSAWTAASADYDHGTDEEKLASEASFIAVLLRLMTFITPSLARLDGKDQEVAMRFSRMAILANECLGSHPTVKLEAMAFQEVLSQHQYLLPAHAEGVKYVEHAVLSCIPMLMDSISPRRLTIHPDQDASIPRSGMASPLVLRAALKVIRVLSLSNILVAEWSGMKMVSLLFAALEEFVGTQTFAGNTLHRGISAPRESELLFKTPDSTSLELSQVMRLLVLLERSQSSKCFVILLRYILLSRCIAMGSSANLNEDDYTEDQPFSVARIVESALTRANQDAGPILEFANPVRWQVKVLAVQVMKIALNEMASKSLSEGLALGSTSAFNPKEAKLECTTACREATQQGAGIPPSILSLHIGAIVTAACGMATATVDQAELRCLQESAMHLICQVIECFGNIPDPDQPGTTVLNDDIPQISSAIKNGLVAPTEDQGAAPCRLFLASCRTLQMFLKMKVTADKGVLKRMFRPVVPEPGDMVVFGVDNKLPTATFQGPGVQGYADTRANLLVHISKVWTLGNIPTDEEDLMALVKVDKAALGAHAASLAIDGARLLLNFGMTLCGTKADGDQVAFDPAYLGNWTDIDESVKAALGSSWATLASTAINFLVQTIESSNDTDEAEAWLRRIVPFVFAGFGDAATALSNPTAVRSKHEWAGSVKPAEIASDCLKALTILSSKQAILELDSSWKGKVEGALSGISLSIFEPILSGRVKRTSSPESEMELVKTSCSLLLNLTKLDTIAATEDSSLLLAILRPLSLLESGLVDLTSRQSSLIVSACFSAVAKIISNPSTPASLVKAMVAVALHVSSSGKELPANVQTAIRILMKVCLAHDAVTLKEQSDIAVAMAHSKDFETWSVVVQAKEGVAAKASLAIVQESLLGCIQDAQQLPVLVALRNLLQSSPPPPNDFFGRIICSVLTEVLSVFQAYGTLQVPTTCHSHRTAVCADGMKIALVAIQQFSSDSSTTIPPDDVAQLLVVIFQSLIAVLRFNGIPNHPSPHPGSSDPALGRMCAQAITHIARTAALPFKSSMGFLSEPDRAVLEFAVRADMSGYAPSNTATSSQAPAKKKLNLQGFKK